MGGPAKGCSGGTRLQAKDIPDRAVLEFVEKTSMVEALPLGGQTASCLPRWVFCWDFERDGYFGSLPWKVVQAKLRQLLKRKLLTGCGCGCRGDWELTVDGERELGRMRGVASVPVDGLVS